MAAIVRTVIARDPVTFSWGKGFTKEEAFAEAKKVNKKVKMKDVSFTETDATEVFIDPETGGLQFRDGSYYRTTLADGTVKERFYNA